MLKKNFIAKTKYGSHQCIAEPEKDMGGYTVEARGVAGALSWGKTLASAKKKVIEAIEGAIEAHALVQAEQNGSVKISAVALEPLLA